MFIFTVIGSGLIGHLGILLVIIHGVGTHGIDLTIIMDGIDLMILGILTYGT